MTESTAWEDSVNAIVEKRLAEVRQEHDHQVEALRAELEAERERTAKAAVASPIGQVPENGGGPGTEIAETWSQWEQENARKE